MYLFKGQSISEIVSSNDVLLKNQFVNKTYKLIRIIYLLSNRNKSRRSGVRQKRGRPRVIQKKVMELLVRNVFGCYIITSS